jgi:hypothetical protein
MAASDVLQLFNLLKPTVGPIVLDASINESHAVDVEWTENPIEEGGIVSDHAIVAPRVVVIEGIVTRFPDSLLPPLKFTRHLLIWRRLRDMAIRRELYDIVTSLEIYPRMGILSVRTPRSNEWTHASKITIVARKMEFSVLDAAQVVSDAATDIAQGKAELGAQAALIARSTEIAAMTASLARLRLHEKGTV